MIISVSRIVANLVDDGLWYVEIKTARLKFTDDESRIILNWHVSIPRTGFSKCAPPS